MGEANGDLTWFENLDDAEKQLVNKSRSEWSTFDYDIYEEEHPKHAILNYYKEAFDAADAD